MIKINLLSKDQQKLAMAVAKFQEEHYNKSFSQRHPELGKMIKCQTCGRRHRTSEKH
jgi:hypothetical protein